MRRILISFAILFPVFTEVLAGPEAQRTAEERIARLGVFQGERDPKYSVFRHEITVRDCILTKLQQRLEDDGSLLRWHVADVDLRKSGFAGIGSEGLFTDWNELAPGQLSATTFFSTMDRSEFPVEMPKFRKLARQMIERGKARPAANGRADSHVVFEMRSMMIHFNGADAAKALGALLNAIDEYQSNYCRLAS